MTYLVGNLSLLYRMLYNSSSLFDVDILDRICVVTRDSQLDICSIASNWLELVGVSVAPLVAYLLCVRVVNDLQKSFDPLASSPLLKSTHTVLEFFINTSRALL